MKKTFLLLAAMCCLVINAWSNDSIVYKASEKLVLTKVNFFPEFNQHEFSDGRGTIYFPDPVQKLNSNAFKDCKTMTEVTLPSTLKEIGESAFFNCKSIKSIVLPDSVSSIGEMAFAYCSSLESISVAAGNKVFDSRGNCNAVVRKKDSTIVVGCFNTVFHESIFQVDDYAFAGASKIVDLVIPEGVQYIGKWAFALCTGMKTLHLSKDILCIDEYAFFGDTLLATITCEAVRPPQLGKECFGSGVDKSIPVYVPATKVTDYVKANWGGFTNFKAIGSGTGIEEVHNAQCTMHNVRKVMKEGELLILREGEVYSVAGGRL